MDHGDHMRRTWPLLAVASLLIVCSCELDAETSAPGDTTASTDTVSHDTATDGRDAPPDGASDTAEAADTSQTTDVDDATGSDTGRDTGDAVATDAAPEPVAFESVPASADAGYEAFLYTVPDEPRGLLWVFHGSGGGRGVCRRFPLAPAFRALVDAGFALVCPQSRDRDAKQWDGGTRSSPGPDMANVRAVRDYLHDEGIVAESLPEFGWGISNGGGFVGQFAYRELRAGVDLRAIQCMIARCKWGAAAGEEFGLTIHWAAAENDPIVAFDGVETTHDEFTGPKSLTVAEHAPLTAAALRRLARTTASEAEQLRAAIASEGLLDQNGRPACDTKADNGCLRRLADAYDAAGVDTPRTAARHAFDNCRATHLAFHRTCDGDDNTATVIDAFESTLE